MKSEPVVRQHAVSERVAESWDVEAAIFDSAPDHGLRDPAVRDTWKQLLIRHLPVTPARIADLGCGTGSLSLLMAEVGHDVDGIDFSPQMLGLAAVKVGDAAGVHFFSGDASKPPLPTRHYDVVICRHVLWALPDPLAALTAWKTLLVRGGRAILIEGQWSSGAGISALVIAHLLAEAGFNGIFTEELTAPEYWGNPISDDRYLITGVRS